MTKNYGVLLFDQAEDSINGWENQLGYRGVLEVWKRKDEMITIEPYDDCEHESYDNYDGKCDGNSDTCTCQDVWYHDNETGYVDFIGRYPDFETADKEAKDYMKNN